MFSFLQVTIYYYGYGLMSNKLNIYAIYPRVNNRYYLLHSENITVLNQWHRLSLTFTALYSDYRVSQLYEVIIAL